jgi:hypothetical protein
MPTINHTHTYIRLKNKPGFYRCNSPDCTHHANKDVILGKLSLCTDCQQPMILTREDLRRARPKCLNCSDTKKAKHWRKAQELTRYLGTEAFEPLSTLIVKSHTSGLEPEPELDSEELEDQELDFQHFSNEYPDPPDFFEKKEPKE